MKKTSLLFLIIITMLGCKNSDTQKETNETPVETENYTKAEQIAIANGFQNFKEVQEITYTFNVKVNDTLKSERHWKWLPKQNKIELTEQGKTFSYIKNDSLNEMESGIDGKFINDSYWLLFPYQLIWSEYDASSEEIAVAPISKKELNKMTVHYSNDGGYTPGDKYHIYYGDDLKIQEWTFESSTGRTLTTTWEDYQNFNGLEIAKMHKTEEGKFQLYFTNISVK